MSPSRPRTVIVMACLAVVLMVSAVLSLAFGAESIPVATVWSVVRAHLVGGAVDPSWNAIVWDLRAPRTVLAAVAGAALSVAGTTMQTLVRNPLADPYLLGVSAGASVGATAVITIGAFSSLGIWALSGGALIGALVASVLVFGVAMAQGGLTPLRLVLTGVVLSAAFSAMANFLVFFSEDPRSAQSVLFWMLGSVAGATWPTLVPASIIMLACVLGLVAIAQWLDALAAGPDVAASLGVPVGQLRIALFVLLALLVGVTVAVSGGIGFVGLVVPHMVRMVVGARHRAVIPVAALGGAVFLLWVDVAARVSVRPQEIPLGVVTGVIGAPVFLLLVGRRRQSMGAQA